MPGLSKDMLRLSFRLGASVIALSTALSMSAQAQTESAAAAPPQVQDTGGIETVVVTAEKRAENVQNVGMSISAFSGDQLENRGITSMTDLAKFVPSLNILQTNNNRNSVVQIRGIGTSGSNPGIEPDVGVFVDGVYIGAAGAIQQNLLDISTVEILRGPQGTLYGRNTPVGAVNINTRAPSQTPEAMLDVEIGNYSERRVAGYVGGGITDDVAGRLSMWTSSRSGYETNLYNNSPINGTDQYGGRGRILWTPTDDLSVNVIGFYAKINQKCCTADQIDPTGIGGIATPGFLAASEAAGRPFINFNGRDHKVDDETVGDDGTDMWGISVSADYTLPWSDTLTSITAYNRFQDHIRELAADGLPLDLAHGEQTLNRGAFSQELRIASGKQFLEYVAGIYLFHEDLVYLNNITVHNPNRAFGAGFITLHPGDMSNFSFDESVNSFAGFGQATANITDALRLTGGLRYNYDHKNATVVNVDTTTGTAGQSTVFRNSLFPELNLPNLRRTEHRLTWQLGGQYDITEGVMAYVTASTGYKTGGYNARAQSPTVPITFDAESAINYELGVKTTLFGNRLVFNADIYRMLLHAFQDSTLNPLTGSGFIVSNAGNRRVQGVEIDAQARPVDELSLTAGLTYADAEFTDYPAGQCPAYPGAFLATVNTTPAGTCSFTGLTPAFNPKWRVNGTAQWEQPFEKWHGIDWFIAGDISYIGSQYLDATLDPRSFQDSYTLLGARIGVEAESGLWRVSIWGRNLSDQTYYVYTVPEPLGAFASGGSNVGAGGFAGWYGAPRTFGIEGTFRF
ncbi:MAG TPA: TonB-dependent receptor [Rhizomicrobium sp.]|jgi:iron complex outermembrane receptor protein|nr:TonB-dependent receptor [Rhizomicrobium sp.]